MRISTWFFSLSFSSSVTFSLTLEKKAVNSVRFRCCWGVEKPVASTAPSAYDTAGIASLLFPYPKSEYNFTWKNDGSIKPLLQLYCHNRINLVYLCTYIQLNRIMWEQPCSPQCFHCSDHKVQVDKNILHSSKPHIRTLMAELYELLGRVSAKLLPLVMCCPLWPSSSINSTSRTTGQSDR